MESKKSSLESVNVRKAGETELLGIMRAQTNTDNDRLDLRRNWGGRERSLITERGGRLDSWFSMKQLVVMMLLS